jgi:hypothetical protein
LPASLHALGIAIACFAGHPTQGDAMSDDPKNRGAQDRARINLGEEHELRYWTGALGVSREQLAAAVQAVGSSADRVRAHLAGDGRRRAGDRT